MLAFAGCRTGPAPSESDRLPGTDAAAVAEILATAALPLDLRFDRRAGRISGRVPPGPAGERAAAVDIDLAPDLFVDPAAPAIRLAAHVDVGGDFDVALPSSQVLRGGRALTLTVRTEGDVARVKGSVGDDVDVVGVVGLDVAPPPVIRRKVPFLRVSLHPGDVVGAGAPNVPVTIELRAPAGVLRGVGLARSDGEGDFRTWVRDADGERVRPRVGDVVEIDAGDGPWSLVVPDLAGGAEAGGSRLAGTGVAGARIDLTLWNPWRPGEYATPRTHVDADGRWSADPGVPIEPATHYYITEHLQAGDQVFHCHQLPRLHLEPGSPRVRIEALSDIEAHVSLERGGREVARAAGAELWSGELALELADGGGRPVPLAAGDVVHAVVNGEAIDLPVPVFEAELDAEANEVRGRTVPGWRVALAAPAPDMAGAREADGDGRFVLAMGDGVRDPGPLSPGERITAFAVLPEGHNVGHLFEMPAIEVDLDAVGGAGGAPDADDVDMSLTFDPATGRAGGRGPSGEALELKVFVGRLDPGESLSVTPGDEGDWSLDLRGMPGAGFRYDPAAVRVLELRWTDAMGRRFVVRWAR